MASHLTLEEREVIAQMHRAGKMQTQIADRLGRSKSTISRELRRNRSRNGYWTVAAQRKAERRRSERPWTAKMARPEVRSYVSTRLRWRWSPDQIAGRSRSDFPDDRRRQVSRPTVYAWIDAEQAGEKQTVRQAAAQRYATTPPALRKTLTLDNGKEFAEHQRLEVEAALKIYFAKPYSAWQRGTNENTNGLIRQFFPKGTDLANIPEHRFTKVQQLLNDRPRKRLGYRSPNEVLASRLKGCD
jgi:IS30 family transposase